jgi:hypothetical protein
MNGVAVLNCLPHFVNTLLVEGLLAEHDNVAEDERVGLQSNQAAPMRGATGCSDAEVHADSHSQTTQHIPSLLTKDTIDSTHACHSAYPKRSGKVDSSSSVRTAWRAAHIP